jgi:hypothetical protein
MCIIQINVTVFLWQFMYVMYVIYIYILQALYRECTVLTFMLSWSYSTHMLLLTWLKAWYFAVLLYKIETFIISQNGLAMFVLAIA